MDIDVRTPGTVELGRICSVLGEWQNDGGPLHLHPGDLGWYSLRGPAATAAATRVWSQDETILAIALLDGPDLLRFAIHPRRRRDAALALRIVADVNNPSAGILGAGAATIEARCGRFERGACAERVVARRTMDTSPSRYDSISDTIGLPH